MVTYALPQQPANLFSERVVGENTLIRSKLGPVSPTKWPIWVTYLDSMASVLDVTQTELLRTLTRDPLWGVEKY